MVSWDQIRRNLKCLVSWYRRDALLSSCLNSLLQDRIPFMILLGTLSVEKSISFSTLGNHSSVWWKKIIRPLRHNTAELHAHAVLLSYSDFYSQHVARKFPNKKPRHFAAVLDDVSLNYHSLLTLSSNLRFRRVIRKPVKFVKFSSSRVDLLLWSFCRLVSAARRVVISVYYGQTVLLSNPITVDSFHECDQIVSLLLFCRDLWQWINKLLSYYEICKNCTCNHSFTQRNMLV